MSNSLRSLFTTKATSVLLVLLMSGGRHVGAESNPQSIATFRKTVQEVRVVFSVDGEQQALSTPLSSADITVLDDGRPVAAVTAFQHDNDTPLHLLLLVDASDSMKEEFEEERLAAQRAFQTLIRLGIDRAGLVDFSAKATPTEGFAVLRTVTYSRTAEGQTALYDTLYGVVQALAEPSHEQPARRMILLFSDGEDNWSRHNLEDVVNAAQKNDISIVSATVHSRRLEFPGDAVLQHLSDSTGGRFFLLRSYNAIDKVLAAIRNQSHYTLTFRRMSDESVGGYHSLKIKSRRRNLKIRCRNGYYADPMPLVSESQ